MKRNKKNFQGFFDINFFPEIIYQLKFLIHNLINILIKYVNNSVTKR